MSRSIISSRIASRAGVAALSVATAVALAVPVASADEADSTGSADLPSTSTGSASLSFGSAGDTPETPGTDAPDTDAPGTEGSDASAIVSSVAGTDWVKLFKVLAALSTGAVSSSTLADAAELSADSGIGLDDVIGSVSGAVAGSSDGGTAAE